MNQQTLKNIIRFLHETEYDDERDRDQHIQIVENVLKNKMKITNKCDIDNVTMENGIYELYR